MGQRRGEPWAGISPVLVSPGTSCSLAAPSPIVVYAAKSFSAHGHASQTSAQHYGFRDRPLALPIKLVRETLCDCRACRSVDVRCACASFLSLFYQKSISI